MNTKTNELVKVLDQLINLLKKDGDTQWKKWLEEIKRSLVDSDYSGIEYLLGTYGGMGSFNDLIIGQSYVNGEFEWKPNADQNNGGLEELRSQAYDLANFIKRNYEIKKT